MAETNDRSAWRAAWRRAQLHAARRLATNIDLDYAVAVRMALINRSESGRSKEFGTILRNAAERVDTYLADAYDECFTDYIRLLYYVRARLRVATCIRGQTYVTQRSTEIEYDVATTCC